MDKEVLPRKLPDSGIQLASGPVFLCFSLHPCLFVSMSLFLSVYVSVFLCLSLSISLPLTVSVSLALRMWDGTPMW